MRLINTSNRVGLVNLNRGDGAVELMPNAECEFTQEQLVHGVMLTSGRVVEAEKPAEQAEVVAVVESGDNAQTDNAVQTDSQGEQAQ